MQCAALTLKGEPCKLKALPGSSYCKVHVNGTKFQPKIHTGPEKKGYIYAYTVNHTNVHLYDHRRQQFVPLKKEQTSGCLSCFPMRRKPAENSGFLVKVGYTTKTPEARLKEWSTKCQQHSYKLLEPPRNASTPFHPHKGWPSNTPRKHEAIILLTLRKMFGVGHVECHGCDSKHIEWFLISDNSQLAKLYNVIERSILI